MSQDIQTAAEAVENEVLPRQVEAHAAGSGETGQKPLPNAVTRKSVKQKSAAEWAYERLILYIQNFEKQLDNEHEVAMGFAGNETGVLRIEGLGYLAISRFVWVDWFPVMRGTHQMLWCRVRLAGG